MEIMKKNVIFVNFVSEYTYLDTGKIKKINYLVQCFVYIFVFIC